MKRKIQGISILAAEAFNSRCVLEDGSKGVRIRLRGRTALVKLRQIVFRFFSFWWEKEGRILAWRATVRACVWSSNHLTRKTKEVGKTILERYWKNWRPSAQSRTLFLRIIFSSASAKHFMRQSSYKTKGFLSSPNNIDRREKIVSFGFFDPFQMFFSFFVQGLKRGFPRARWQIFDFQIAS